MNTNLIRICVALLHFIPDHHIAFVYLISFRSNSELGLNCVEKAVKSTSTTQEPSKSDEVNPYKRASSLKSGKTPPGTPGRKKLVR